MGRGIYLASEHAKSAFYVHPGRQGRDRVGVMLLVQAALGNMHTILQDDWQLTQPPAGVQLLRYCLIICMHAQTNLSMTVTSRTQP